MDRKMLLTVLFVCLLITCMQAQEPILYQEPHCTLEAYNPQRQIYYRCEAPTIVLYVELDGKQQSTSTSDSQRDHAPEIKHIDISSNTTCKHKYEGDAISDKCIVLNMMIDSGLEKDALVKSIDTNHNLRSIQLNLTLPFETKKCNSKMSGQNGTETSHIVTCPLAHILPCPIILILLIIISVAIIITISGSFKRGKTNKQEGNTTVNSEICFKV